MDATSAAELLDEGLRLRCPSCERVHDEAAWQCLPWLQYAGAVRLGRAVATVEVRRCICTQSIGRHAALPMVEVLP